LSDYPPSSHPWWCGTLSATVVMRDAQGLPRGGRGGELVCVATSGLLLVEEHACVANKHLGVLEVRAVASVGVEDQLGVRQELLQNVGS
jgi:hypothetical protein